MIAVAECHPMVIGMIHRQHLLFGEDIEEVNLHLHILHVCGDGKQFGKQLERLGLP